MLVKRSQGSVQGKNIIGSFKFRVIESHADGHNHHCGETRRNKEKLYTPIKKNKIIDVGGIYRSMVELSPRFFSLFLSLALSALYWIFGYSYAKVN